MEAGRNYAGPSVACLSSSLPNDARAVIERDPRSVTQSALADRRGWRLRFYPRRPLGVDPLTGWTTGADPLAHLSLRFPHGDAPLENTTFNDGWDRWLRLRALNQKMRTLGRRWSCSSPEHPTPMTWSTTLPSVLEELAADWEKMMGTVHPIGRLMRITSPR